MLPKQEIEIIPRFSIFRKMLLFLFLGLLSELCSCSDLEMEGDMRLRLDHSFDLGQSWENRGSVALTRSRLGSASVNQEI